MKKRLGKVTILKNIVVAEVRARKKIVTQIKFCQFIIEVFFKAFDNYCFPKKYSKFLIIVEYTSGSTTSLRIPEITVIKLYNQKGRILTRISITEGTRSNTCKYVALIKNTVILLFLILNVRYC